MARHFGAAHDDRRRRRRGGRIHRPRPGDRHPRPQHRVAQRAAQGDPRGAASTCPSPSRTTRTPPAGRSSASARGADVDHMVMLTMGTGVGGAVVIDGELFRGGHGIAGELGHIRFIRDGLPCGCGQNGCLEQYASGRALQREAERDRRRAAASATRSPTLRAEKGTISGPAVSRLVLAGDPGAIEALRRVATALGEACGGFQAVLDPELFVIGGGVAQLGEDLLGPVRIAYETSLPGYGDRPVADVRDRAARQRRRPDRRGRPRDARGVADVLLADEVRGDRTDLEGDLPPMDRRPPQHPRRGRRDPREQPPVVHRLGLPAAHDRPARVVPREERLLHGQGPQGLGDAHLPEGDRASCRSTDPAARHPRHPSTPACRCWAAATCSASTPRAPAAPTASSTAAAPGIARMALEAHVPVVPVVMVDTDTMMPIGATDPARRAGRRRHRRAARLLALRGHGGRPLHPPLGHRRDHGRPAAAGRAAVRRRLRLDREGPR